jgi:hypothetical protein
MSAAQLDDAVLSWVQEAAEPGSRRRRELEVAEQQTAVDVARVERELVQLSAEIDGLHDQHRRAEIDDQALVAGIRAREPARTECRDRRGALRARRALLADAMEALDAIEWKQGSGDLAGLNQELRRVVSGAYVGRGTPGKRTLAHGRVHVRGVCEPHSPPPLPAAPPGLRQPPPGETEERILSILSSRELSAAEVARELNLTSVAIRRQLARLLGAGRILVDGLTQGQRGRPARTYRAVARAEIMDAVSPVPRPE